MNRNPPPLALGKRNKRAKLTPEQKAALAKDRTISRFVKDLFSEAAARNRTDGSDYNTRLSGAVRASGNNRPVGMVLK